MSRNGKAPTSGPRRWRDGAGRYGLISRVNHWVVAALMIPMMGSGLALEYAPLAQAVSGLLRDRHKALGVVVLGLGLWRVGWRLGEGFPHHEGPQSSWQERAAKVMHWALLAAIVVMPLSGLVMTLIAGRSIAVLGLAIPAAPQVEWLAQAAGGIHAIGGPALAALVFFHVAAALGHHRIGRGDPAGGMTAEPRRAAVEKTASLLGDTEAKAAASRMPGRLPDETPKSRGRRLRDRGTRHPISTLSRSPAPRSPNTASPGPWRPPMPNPAFPFLLLLAAVPAVLPSGLSAQGTTVAQGATVESPDPADRTPAIVATAEAFLATLDDGQREAVLFGWEDDEQRANWSNFPTGIYERAGLRWGDLSRAQQDTLTALLGTVLSEDGLRMVQEQMAADEVLKAGEGGGAGGGFLDRVRGLLGGGGPGDLVFGSDEYFVSFVGAPSATEPWMLQFGGHHLGINATVVGPYVTLAPSLTGGQPVRFTLDGQAIDIVVDEVTAAGALLASLSEEQLAQAVRSETRSDLVLGPGHDGETLLPEGLMGADMSDDQHALLLALIEARLGMLNADDLAATMAPIETNLDATAFAWFGPTDDPASAYWRVTGPTLILEFSPQEMGGDAANHLHNMYRDPTNDYGAAWAASE